MAFTGDLEHLPIVDIIQLVHTTRKSGIFSVKGDKGESRIVFSNGNIVGANHINDSVRIGTVLVKTGAISIDDLKQAMGSMKNADENRVPLLQTLVQTGKLKREDALRGLKKLVELTIIELMNWTRGTFTFDTEAVVVPSEGEQDFGVDAQMVLMDALRISDERERDRASGKEVPPFETLYADVLPGEGGRAGGGRSTITADDLGLGDLDRLEKKIPRPVSEMEIFDPVEIRRQKTKELLPGFSSDEQEAFASFLKKPAARTSPPASASRQAGKAVVMFSGDTLISHSVLSLCNDAGILAIATDDEKELDRMVSQCLLSARMPLVVFDGPLGAAGRFSAEKIKSLRNRVRAKYSAVPVLQFASPHDSDFVLGSYHDGVRAVLPKPSKEDGKHTYIQDMLKFLEAFKSYVAGFQYGSDDADIYGKKLKEGILALRGLTNPSDAPLVALTAVSDMFERAVTLLVRPSELMGERAIGLTSDKSMGPTPADRLKVPLAKPSVFRDVLENGRVYFGESGDETLRAFFADIGSPLSPAIILLPLLCDRKVIALIYGDFGKKAAAPVRLDMLEILAHQVGIVLEFALFRRQAAKAQQSQNGLS